MTKIQKVQLFATLVLFSLSIWLLLTAERDDAFQIKMVVALLCVAGYMLLKRLPSIERLIQDKLKAEQGEPITVYIGKATEDARATRLAHLEGFVDRLGFSSDKVVSFMVDDSDRVCKDLALKSICVSDDKLRQNFNNPDLDVEKIKDWLISNLTFEPLTKEQLMERSMRHTPDQVVVGEMKNADTVGFIETVEKK